MDIDVAKTILPENAHDYPIVNGTLCVPEGIEAIVGAYRGNGSLQRVELPKGFRILGDGAFTCCGNLESVEFPKTLEAIGAHAFASCSKLREVVLPNGLKRLGSCAFAHCSGLARIEIPPSVTDFGDNVFYGCSSDLVFVVQYGSPVCELLKTMGAVRVHAKCWDEQLS